MEAGFYPKTAKPAAPYTLRAPSPPSVLVPSTSVVSPLKVVPCYDNIDPASLSAKDLAIITQNSRVQVAHDAAPYWTYENRRVAQPILDYLYLGPSSVVRDRRWLQEHGITMILAVRDTQQASLNLMTFDDLAREMGIESRYVDVSGYHELIREFPSAVRLINNHMLRIYQEQAVDTISVNMSSGDMTIDGTSFRRGRILVFCETGNERSAGIVCAYLMAVLGMSTEQACQFINYARFCVSMGEPLKQTLKAYEDILVAQRTVHKHELRSDTAASSNKAKRGIAEAMSDEDDHDMWDVVGYQNSDRERFVDRDNFTPFIDTE